MRLTLVFAILLFGYSTLSYAQAPRVVVTLKPLHSLVAGLMMGVATPQLLLPDGASPHTYQLKPSTLKQLQQADLIIWVGPALELFMVKALHSVQPRLGLITVLDIPHLQTYPQRHGRQWHDHAGHDHGTVDPHVWLSTDNAQIFVNTLSAYLTKADPLHAKQYAENAKKLTKEIAALKTQLQTLLAPVHKQPFLVYHDGYQYFEKEFDLHPVGTMMVNPHLPLSANGLNVIKTLIKDHHVHCVFRETEFNDNMTQQLGSLSVKIAELDPLGTRFPPGPENYAKTLVQMGTTLRECLERKSN